MENSLSTKLSDRFPAEIAALKVYSLRVTGALLTFLLHIALARWLGTYEFGIFAFVWAVLIVLGELLSFGFYNLIQGLIPQYRYERKPSLIRGAIWGSAAIIAITSLLFVILFASALYLLYSYNFISEIYTLPLIIAILALPAFALSDYLSGIGRSYDWMTSAFIPTAVFRPITIVALVAGLIMLGISGDATIAIACSTAAIWLTLAFSFFTIANKIPSDERVGPRDYAIKPWFIAALPMMIISSFELLLFNIDIFMISKYLSPDQTGIYFAATKIMALIAFLNYAIGSAFTARYAQYHASNNQKALAEIVKKSATLTLYPCLAMISIILLFRTQLLSLFGPGFENAEIVILILAIGLIFRAAIGPGERVLMMTGHQNLCAIIYLTTASLDVVLNIILIPEYGILGAAIATTISFVVMAISLLLTIKMRLNILSFAGLPPKNLKL